MLIPRPSRNASPAPAPGPEDVGDLIRVRRPVRARAERGSVLRHACMVSGLVAMLLVLVPPADTQPTDVYYEIQRRRMVEEQIERRGITSPAVLEAMRKVPRHRFVPPIYMTRAYADSPVPIGRGQTISQPYIVARMTELLELTSSSRVLEIGTGSGYHAAVLGQVAGEVYTIEIVEDLGGQARERLADLGYRNIHVKIGDGYRGWPEQAPFDAIILTAAPAEPPEPLLAQLAVGGKMVLPQGDGGIQDLLVVTKTQERLERQRISAVRFVPMTGEAAKPKKRD